SASPIDHSVPAVARSREPRPAPMAQREGFLLARAILTRLTRTRPKAARGRLLRAAALGLGMLWLCVIALATVGVKGHPLLVLRAIGLLGTVALLPAAH